MFLAQMRKLAVVILLVVAVSLTVGLRYHAVSSAASFDEGAFLAAADQVTTYGKVMYRDVVDHKPPGIVALLSVLLRFSRSSEFIRLIFLGMTALNCVLVFFIVKVAKIPKTFGVLAAFLYAIDPIGVKLGAFMFTENLVAFWELSTILCVLIAVRKEKLKAFLLAGVCAGLALVSKQSGLIVIVAVFLSLGGLILYGRAKWNSVMYFGIGILLVQGLILIIVWINGSLVEYLDLVWLTNLSLIKGPQFALSTKFDGFWQYAQADFRLIFAFAVIPMMIWFRNKQIFPVVHVVTVWFFLEWFSLFWPATLNLEGGLSHYAIPAGATTSIVAAIVSFQLWTVFGNQISVSIRQRLHHLDNGKRFGLSVVITLVFLSVLTLPQSVKRIIEDVDYRLNPYYEPVAEYVINNSSSDEAVLNLYHPMTLFLTGRESGSRFIYYATGLNQTRHAERYIQELTTDVVTQTPAFIVLEHWRESLLGDGFVEVLNDNYDIRESFGPENNPSVSVYARRN